MKNKNETLLEWEVDKYVKDEEGEVGRIISNNLKRPCFVAIEWEDGRVTDEDICHLSLLSGNPKALEEEFEKTFHAIHSDIQKNVAIAHRALSEAIKLSEANGIPFVANIQNTYGYIPTTYLSKYSELEATFTTGLTNLHIPDWHEPTSGWQDSSTYC
jgi:hypothetical protein